MLTVLPLPARNGDSIWIEYGEGAIHHRTLIDTGTPGTYRDIRAHLLELEKKARSFELLVVSHVDNDHVGGCLRLLEARDLGLKVGDVWFNGWKHLPEPGPAEVELEELGPPQGERLSALLCGKEISWNGRFGGCAVAMPETARPSAIELDSGLRVTPLSPRLSELQALRPVWHAACIAANLDPNRPIRYEEPRTPKGLEILGAEPPPLPDAVKLAAQPFEPDTKETNGSSIALLIEYRQQKVLISGDAHPAVLLDSLDRLVGSEGSLELDLLLVPHHGSRHNVSTELIERMPARHYLFSTSGAVHGHPHAEAVSRVIVSGLKGAQLDFNYKSATTAIWEDKRLTDRWGYTTNYAETQGKVPFRIEL